MAEPDGADRRGERILPTVVAYTITVGWSISFMLNMLRPSYSPHPSITPLMIAVATFCFGGKFLPRRRNGADTDDQ